MIVYFAECFLDAVVLGVLFQVEFSAVAIEVAKGPAVEWRPIRHRPDALVRVNLLKGIDDFEELINIDAQVAIFDAEPERRLASLFPMASGGGDAAPDVVELLLVFDLR